MSGKHTPGPWSQSRDLVLDSRGWSIARCMEGDEFIDQEANARLIAAAPEMLAALASVNKLISEAAMTGFNYKDGDWPERLFLSQQATSAAIRKALGHRPTPSPASSVQGGR